MFEWQLFETHERFIGLNLWSHHCVLFDIWHLWLRYFIVWSYLFLLRYRCDSCIPTCLELVTIVWSFLCWHPLFKETSNNWLLLLLLVFLRCLPYNAHLWVHVLLLRRFDVYNRILLRLRLFQLMCLLFGYFWYVWKRWFRSLIRLLLNFLIPESSWNLSWVTLCNIGLNVTR